MAERHVIELSMESSNALHAHGLESGFSLSEVVEVALGFLALWKIRGAEQDQAGLLLWPAESGDADGHHWAMEVHYLDGSSREATLGLPEVKPGVVVTSNEVREPGGGPNHLRLV